MHADNNQRAAEEARLICEENRFSKLGHTAIRKQAYTRMFNLIQDARSDCGKSIMAKQIAKVNAQKEYDDLVRVQAEERATVTAAAGTRHFP